ncbi:MAG: LD-carboxypeptidase [Rhodothermales bacterium]|nr:LD-carboxypeptidase [Rhodothermales bacterium]MBO6779787.1 LD-carboxypeptidase [Rhodothermales bacterium]
MTRSANLRRIGLLAPAGPPLDAERLERGLRHLEDRGVELVRPRSSYPVTGFLAGSDDARLAEFHALCREPDIDTIFCVRGGYGTLRLLDQIDYDLAAARPRVLVGYSDITALQLALFTRSGWRGVSGPMVGVEWPEPEADWESQLWQLLEGESAVSFASLDGSRPSTLRAGTAEGPLLGGNLATLVRLVGTPYLPDLRGCLLFLEDVGEVPYRLDALFAQLKLAGHLEGLAGVILGAFTDSDPPHNRPSFSVDEVLQHYFGGASYPVVSDWNYGHFPRKMSLPIGPRARLVADPAAATLQLLEPLRI